MIVQSREFERLLRLAGDVRGRAKYTMPVLQNCILDASGDVLKITATDLETWLEVKMPVVGEKDFSITVPGLFVADLMRWISDTTVVVDYMDRVASIKIWHGPRGAKGYSVVKGIDPSDYPMPSVVGDTQEQPAISGKELTKFVSNLSVASDSGAGALPIYNCAAFVGGMVAATDKNSILAFSPDGRYTGVQVPLRSMVIAAKAFASESAVPVHVGKDYIRMETPQALCVAPLVKEKFPDIGPLIRSVEKFPISIEADRGDLLKAIMVCMKSDKGIRFTCEFDVVTVKPLHGADVTVAVPIVSSQDASFSLPASQVYGIVKQLAGKVVMKTDNSAHFMYFANEDGAGIAYMVSKLKER